MTKGPYQVRAYSVKHSYDVKGFLEAYMLMLQRTVGDVVQDNMERKAVEGKEEASTSASKG